MPNTKQLSLLIMSSTNNFIPYHTTNREWDARFNIPTQQDLDSLVSNIKSEADKGKFRYVLISGVEVGDRPYQNDYLLKHVHVALVYNNRATKSSILKNLMIKEGNGYYLVPRARHLPYSGWIAHHKKIKTKICEDQLVIFEYGELPQDRLDSKMPQARSEGEKKRKLDDIIVEMKEDIEAGRDDEAFKKFPRTFLQYGEKLKALTTQKRDFFKTNGDPHIWLYGTPGTGKTAILQVIYPNYYNKPMDSRFFDLYDPKVHTHVLCQDVDHEIVERLGVQLFKSMCDESGYPIDQKYKTPQLCRLCVLVSSNFTITDVMSDDIKGRNDSLAAMHRRFWEVNIRQLLPLLGMKLLSKYELKMLQADGNLDPRKLFLMWDYLRDCPTGEPIPEASVLQQKIKDAFYN